MITRILLVLAFACGVPLRTLAQESLSGNLPGAVEFVVIQTRTPTVEEFLAGAPAGTEASIAGELRIPARGGPKFPAVILMHGGDRGFNAGLELWEQRLNEAGIATLAVDSGSGRRETAGYSFRNITQLSTTRLLDAYRSLKYLSGDARIDPAQIFVMGFSTGAHSALFSSSRRFTNAYAQGARFAGHIGVYSVCNFRFTGDTETTGAPMLMFHGAADDVSSISVCRQYESDLRKAGVDVVFIEFPATRHQFDNPLTAAEVFRPTARTPQGCIVRESGGKLLNADTGAAYSLQDACSTPGNHIGYNADATARSYAKVVEFVTSRSRAAAR